MKKRIVEILSMCIPISRYRYVKDMEKIVKTLSGLLQSESQISQIQMTLLQNIENMKLTKAKKASKKKMKDDIAFG